MTVPAAVATSAQGIDVSAFQIDLTVHDLTGLHFALTKASDGPRLTDPHFAHNWPVIAQAGLHRGTYHELQSTKSGTATQQADHFLDVVSGGVVKPGDMLAVVASDYAGVTDAEVKAFCDHVHAVTAGRNPVLVYTDLDVSRRLTQTSAAGYPLWVAWPSQVAPGPSQWAPAKWKTWTLWQWGTRHVPGLGVVDADAFNGTPAQMDAWIATYADRAEHWRVWETAGKRSLAEIAAACGMTPHRVLHATARHFAQDDPVTVAYVNGVFEGTIPPTAKVPAGARLWVQH